LKRALALHFLYLLPFSSGFVALSRESLTFDVKPFPDCESAINVAMKKLTEKLDLQLGGTQYVV
jgi:hypothetical protein